MEIAHTAPEPKANPDPSPNPSSTWSSIVKSEPAPKPASLQSPGLAVLAAVGSCRSAKGIMMAVVDANAIIEGGHNLLTFADKFVTVPEVMSEIRDPVSRHRLSIIPFSIESIEPSPESLNKVIRFARATGDLQTLSDVDLKLIALTYTLEAQIHGTKHLRDVPPPIHTVNVRRLPEKELPGWGSNVPNLEEWEALENETEENANNNSRILPLKDLNLNTIPTDNHSEDGSLATKGSDSVLEHENEEDPDVRQHRRYPPKKKEINIEGKMVAEGIDASQGQHEDDADDWRPAVSRSTHRRFLRRKSRREYYDALAEKESQENQEKSEGDVMDNNSGKGQQSNPNPEIKHVNNEVSVEKNDDVDISSNLKQMRLEEDSPKALQDAGVEEKDSLRALQDAGLDKLSAETSLVDGNDVSDNHFDVEVNEIIEENEALDALEVSSAATETMETSIADDVSSEQSWMLRSLSESNIACITGDYAMQNVLLQIGLRLLAPGGMQIRQLHRSVLKCHACYTVTAEIGRLFCPKCGNGGTLRKVAVTVGENGVVIAARKPRIMLRGTKYSIPSPQGGRDAITKNPILREDQLPQKFLYPKTKKKTNKQGEVFYAADDTFYQHSEKKAPLKPPVRKALAVFSQKRNPNDNHYSRSLH